MTAPHTLTSAAPQRSPRARHWLAPTRRAATAVAMGAALCLAGASAWAAGTMRVAMTLSDIPVPNGQTDQGAEGMRFIGYTVFGALLLWTFWYRRRVRERNSVDIPTRDGVTEAAGR